jgi:hypothetical protein
VRLHSQLAGAVGDEVSEWIVGEPRNPAGGDSESRRGDSDVELAAADVDVQAARLLQPLEIGRGQADHRFAERHQVHAKSYEQPKTATSVGGFLLPYSFAVNRIERQCRFPLLTSAIGSPS